MVEKCREHVEHQELMAVKPVGCQVTLHRQEPDWPILARMRELGKEALSLRRGLADLFD